MKTFLTILVAIIAAIGGGLFWLGVFQPIEWTETEIGPITVTGTMYTGPFSGMGSTYEKVEAAMTQLGSQPKEMIGVYYDDPKLVPEEKLRSFIGGKLAADDVNKFKGHPELITVVYPKTKCLVAKFPMRILSISPMIGAMKVYPTMEAALEKIGFKTTEPGAVFELCNGEEILYAAPMANQKEWAKVPVKK